MSFFIREVFCCVLYLWYRLTRQLPRVSSIYFHDPSPELFEKVIKWYKRHNYRIVSLAQLMSYLDNHEKPNDRIAFISLDDGWRSNLDLLQVCDKYNAPITLFVATDPLRSGNFWWEYVERVQCGVTKQDFKLKPEVEFYQELATIKEKVTLKRSAMTVEELIYISSQPFITVQSHTVSHPILPNISDESLERELTESKFILESLTGRKVEAFSYPNGDVGQREIDQLKKAGYRYAFTTQTRVFDMEFFNPFLLPRMAMNTNGGLFDNLAKLTGIWYEIKPMVKY